MLLAFYAPIPKKRQRRYPVIVRSVFSTDVVVSILLNLVLPKEMGVPQEVKE